MSLPSFQYTQRRVLVRVVSYGRLSTDSSPLARCHHSGHLPRTASLSNSILTCFKSMKVRCNEVGLFVGENVNRISRAIAQQCSALVAQRMRRSVQIALLYHKLGYRYDGHSASTAVQSLGRGFFRRKSPFLVLLGAVSFQWDQNSIPDEELNEVGDEICHIHRSGRGHTTTVDEHYMDEWEKVIDRDHIKLWRRRIPNSHLYQYKVFGTYTDLPAQAFYNAQLDVDFRKQWDKLVVRLEVVERDEKSGQEVVHWVVPYPFPLYKREYVYIRRAVVDERRRLFVIVTRSVDHPSCPHLSQYVRVETYMSQMVIRAHGSVEENGFDYILTYYDEPKAAIPTAAYNWMASTGVPDFVDKVHDAAKLLHEKKRGVRRDDQRGESPETHLAL